MPKDIEKVIIDFKNNKLQAEFCLGEENGKLIMAVKTYRFEAVDKGKVLQLFRPLFEAHKENPGEG